MKTKVEIIRHIDRWYVVSDGQRFGFAMNIENEEVDQQEVKWFDTRYEAETALLDRLEQMYADGKWRPSEPLLGTTEAAALISEITGQKWDRRYIAQYRRQDPTFPEPDIKIGRRPYWFQSTIEKYAKKKREDGESR
ncbi:hypothetical protein BSNK01_12170 [Bacillaceae bacterium]